MSYKLNLGFAVLVLGLGALVALGPHRRGPEIAREVAPKASQSAPNVVQSLQPAPSASVAIARLRDSRSRACPLKRSRSIKVAEWPALNRKPALLPLLAAGERGQPERVRLRFHHPIAGCECPSFTMSDEPADEGVHSWTYVVFPDDVPNGHEFELGKYYGFTKYEMTGYFSGREVDFYDWAAAQNGESRGEPIGGEQEIDRQARYPEFCVEDWCYRPDPDPVMYKSVKSPDEIAGDRAKYRAVLAEMAQSGAKRCNK